MATQLVPVTIDRSAKTYATPAGAVDAAGNYFTNSGNQFLEVKGATASCTLTVAIPGAVDGVASGGKQYTIAATDDKLIGPFPVNIYGTVVNLAWTNANPKVTLYQLVPNA